MALTMSLRIVIQGIGCILILLLVSSAQAIHYEDHRHDVISASLKSNIVLTSRDFFEELNSAVPKASYSLQEGTEHLLHFGALLRTQILDTFGSLLYIYYDDFSITEVEALHKVYREIFERRYNVFHLVPGILKNLENTRPSKICAEIYAHAQSCLRSSAHTCRGIRRRHDDPGDFDASALNVTYLVYRSAKISKQYPRGFSAAAVLKLLQREVLTATPTLVSGLLQNVRYDSFDNDVRLAERELVRYFRDVARTTSGSFNIDIPESTLTRELKRSHTVNSFLRYYIGIHAKRFPNDYLRRHAFLIAKRIDDVGTIDENIHLLGNVLENRRIHLEYLFDLVLPDDVLENDVIEAKKYLARKLNEFDVVEKYLRVQRYQQATPDQLTMEITGQLVDIDFIKDIATSLRMHARFWRKSHMIESLDELLELFDAYENLRHVSQYQDMMQNIDRIRKSLWDVKDVPIEILCNAPRACLRIGLQSVLRCRIVSPDIKNLIIDFLKSSVMCETHESRRTVSIPFKVLKIFSTDINTGTTWTTETMIRRTTEPSTSKATTRSTTEDYNRKRLETTTKDFESETEETTEEPPAKSDASSEESLELATTTTLPTTTTTSTTARWTTGYGHDEPILTTTASEEETSVATVNTVVATITTITLPTTTTTLPTTTVTSPTTTTTLPTTTMTLPVTTTTLPTTTTTLPTTTTTSTATTTTLPTTTTTLPATTTTLPTTITIAASPTTITTASPITISPTTIEEISTVYEKPTSSTVRTNVSVPNGESSEEIVERVTFATSSMKFCESGECSESGSNETSEHVETTLFLTTTPTTQASIWPSLESSTAEQENVTAVTTEAPITKGGDCAKRSCSEECRSKSESVESARSCEASCDSLTEDCNGEDVSEKVENHTVECPKVRCDEDSSEIPSRCKAEIDKSCECASKEQRSAECVTLCPSDVESASYEEERNDCSTSLTNTPTADLTFELVRKRGMCEIRDPHHRRQLKRLAKMRAISAAAAVRTSRDVLRPRTSRRQSRIASKKLYKLLATKLPRSKESTKIAEYLLKEPLNGPSKIKGEHRKRRKQQQQIHRRRKKLMRRLGERLSAGTHRSRKSRHTKRISTKSERSTIATTRKTVMHLIKELLDRKTL